MPRIKKSPVVEAHESRTRYVGFRMREHDAEELERLAEEQDVGISTFARLIVENYVRQHGTKE